MHRQSAQCHGRKFHLHRPPVKKRSLLGLKKNAVMALKKAVVSVVLMHSIHILVDFSSVSQYVIIDKSATTASSVWALPYIPDVLKSESERLLLIHGAEFRPIQLLSHYPHIADKNYFSTHNSSNVI